jgi:hypothetical protein
MNRAVVGVDDELAIVPVRVLGSADQKFQCELFEDEIVCGFKFIVGKSAEDSAWLGDVLDEYDSLNQPGDGDSYDSRPPALAFCRVHPDSRPSAQPKS